MAVSTTSFGVGATGPLSDLEGIFVFIFVSAATVVATMTAPRPR